MDGAISYGVSVPGREARMIKQFEKSGLGRNALRMPNMDDSGLPDREFRDAWRANQNGSIRVDAQVKQQIMEERGKPTMEDRITQLETKQEAI